MARRISEPPKETGEEIGEPEHGKRGEVPSGYHCFPHIAIADRYGVLTPNKHELAVLATRSRGQGQRPVPRIASKILSESQAAVGSLCKRRIFPDVADFWGASFSFESLARSFRKTFRTETPF